MQTLYYTTRSLIRHTDNVVDLAEYRRRLAQAEEEQEPQEEAVVTLLPSPAPAPRRGRRRSLHRRAMALDACASMGVVAMTLAFTLRVLAM